MSALHDGPVVGAGAVLGPDHVLSSDDPDPAPRWAPGDRLHHVFEQTCDRLRAAGEADRLAVSRGDVRLTYDELDARANRLARRLVEHGVGAGDRVGLLLDDAVWSYTAVLAVLKLHAAYVPLDAGFPADRVAFIVRDAGVAVVLTLAHLRDGLSGAGVAVVALDEERARFDAQDATRLPRPARAARGDELAYVIYTSGTTGRPKGVPIEQAGIVNFVRVAAEVYGVREDDRMYQGLTLAFDFSVEEVWVAWAVGATLVPRPGGPLLGEELVQFLREERVTALCCVPTLLATMHDDLPDVRFLLVSGEACPPDLVTRWYRPGRRFLNTYGPTEATVTATWTTVHPDRPVTIGVPLPTYSVVVLAADGDAVLAPGEQGEIAIAGVCLSPGYLNRPDATARAFVPAPLPLPHNPSGQVYRTGDLGRIGEDGRITYLGRIDTQVKIRGYRVELTEIESILLSAPGIAQAVVDVHSPAPGATELVAYWTPAAGREVDVDAVHDLLRDRLPPYMVPAYFEQLTAIPMLPSDKADRKSLPPPRGPRRVAARGAFVAPEGRIEELLAAAVAELLGLDRVSVQAHLFEDLAMDSLLIARLGAQLRVQPDLPTITTKDVYLHPTVRGLAAALEHSAPRTATGAPRVVRRASTAAYVGCGLVQVGLYVAFAFLAASIGVTGYGWLDSASGPVEVYLRAVALSAAILTVTALLPVVAKWVLVGRWKPGRIPIWSAAYLRFWTVRQLLLASPVRFTAGSPLYNGYLRLLGARVGPGAVVLSTALPVCADLVSIGAGAVVRKDALFPAYRAESGWIRTGRVTIGAGAVVGETAFLDVDTELGDGAQLGHTSSLRTGQVVPAGARAHGSPAVPTTTDYDLVPTGGSDPRRRRTYTVLQLVGLVLGWGPLSTGVLFVVLPLAFPRVDALVGASATGGGDQHEFTEPMFYVEHFLIAGVLLFGTAVLGLVVATTVPRLLERLVPTGVVHPLYGLRYAAHRAVRRLSNLPFFHNLLGDSSFIVGYLRAIGYDLSRVEQTGSNFGLVVKHDSPSRTHVGTGTLVSDGLSVVNADYSATSFRVSDVHVGSRSFFGNAITYPAQGRTGDDCLLGTKVMVPIDGPRRTGVGLLGSPPFEIPRSVQRDAEHDRFRAGAELGPRLRRKNRHNAATIALFLLVRWLQVFGVTLIGLGATDWYDELGVAAYALALVAVLVFTTLSAVLAERAALGFRRLRPRFCSIYEPYFWRHERLWKLSGVAYLLVFNGTPFKPLLWRLLGVRVGRRLFDDGATLPEKTMVTIGDDCTLGAESTIQCHSLEDGSFKSDHIVLGDGVTVGPHTYVHYGVRMADRSVLDADAFLMKGTAPDPDTRWRGNPAVEVSDADAPAVPVSTSAVPRPEHPPLRRRPRSPRRRPVASRPVSGPGRPGPSRPARRSTPTGVAAVLLAALAVLHVGWAALRLPARPEEAGLVDGAFALARDLPVPTGPVSEALARIQVALVAGGGGAFGRHADVLTGAREVVVLAAAVTVAALLLAARRLRMPAGVVAAAFALLAVARPAVEVLATVGPGQLGAMWLAVSAALLLHPRGPVRALGVVALAAGALTAPVVAVVAAVAVVGGSARRRPAVAVLGALAGAAAVVVAWLLAPEPGLVAYAVDPDRLLLLVVGVGVAIGGLLLSGVDGPAAGVGAAAVLASAPWSGSEVALPVLVASAVALGAVLLAEAARTVPRALRQPAARRAVFAVATVAWLGLAALVLPRPAPAPSTHVALAGWLRTATDPATTVAAAPGLWADLVRDGVPVQQLAADGRLTVGPDAGGAELARFGGLAVTDPVGLPAAAGWTGGAGLADNPRLLAPDDVRETVRSGAVDVRLLAVLAGLVGQRPVTVVALPRLPGESAELPRHRVELAALDAATVEWLRGQRAPFLPVVETTPTSTVLTWPVPAPDSLLG